MQIILLKCGECGKSPSLSYTTNEIGSQQFGSVMLQALFYRHALGVPYTFLKPCARCSLSLCKCLLSKCYARVALRAEGTTGNRTVSTERVKLGKKKMLLSPCAESLISPRSVSTAAASQDQARRSLDNKPLRPRKPI